MATVVALPQAKTPQESSVSFAATQDVKEQVRQATDIVELVGSYIPLRREGRVYAGLCPWHDDSRPSLKVNPDRQSWKCWVCDIGGDIFSFVMRREGVEFKEALAMLADRAGVTLPSSGQTAKPRPGDPNDKRTLYEATAWAEGQFRQCLLSSPEAEMARRYFDQRSIHASSRAAFHLGFSPNNRQWLLDRSHATSFSPAVLEAAGLVAKFEDSGRYYDRFRGRVIFPIRDAQNRTIGFGGRILPELATDRSAKYVNSPETRLFSKSEHLYGLDRARDALAKTRSAVVVEGYTDVIMAHQFGLPNVVAVLGTALGPRHIRVLRRYADSITLLLDGDEAGQRRTGEVLELFVAGEVDLRVATLPAGLDPCDFLLQHGADSMRALVDGALDAFDHAMVVQTRGIDLVHDTHRANQALENLLAIVAKAPRLTADTTSAKLLRERQVIARLAREFRVEESVLRTRLSELRAEGGRRESRDKGQEARAGVSNQQSAVRSPQFLDPRDAELLEILALHPELADAALEEIAPDQLSSEPARAIYHHYRIISERGEPADFSRILSELEEPQLKNLFVNLDEQASLKEAHAHEDAAARLRRLIEDLRYCHEESERRKQMAALERQDLDEKEKHELFLKLLEEKRKRQGIPAPTDG